VWSHLRLPRSLTLGSHYDTIEGRVTLGLAVTLDTTLAAE